MFIVGFKRELVCNLNFTIIENQFKKKHLGDSVVACQSVSQSINHVKLSLELYRAIVVNMKVIINW